MDFSEVERAGFTWAFVEFWMMHADNKQLHEELGKAAEHLLRGCEEHFRAGVTRVSRISGVIPSGMAEAFTKHALALLDTEDPQEFYSRAMLVVRDFPKVKSWMEWWLRPSHASMLCKSQRKMDADIWDSIPSTNNAEEAMHWKLYSAAGRDHTFLEGMYSLHAVAIYYERIYQGTMSMY